MSSPEDAVPDAVPPSQAIITAIADREGVDVTEIEPPAYDPLYTVVNTEALDELFASPSAAAGTAHVYLEYEGYEVTVHSDGSVDVSESSSDESVSRPVED